MKFKYFIILLMFSISIFTSACDSAGSDNKGGTSYEFINQELQGEIGGKEWIYMSGYAEEDSFDSSLLDINIYAVDPSGGDACYTFAYSFSEDVILFSVPNTTASYELGTNMIVTLYNYDKNMNYLLTDGLMDILTIDSTSVTGRIAAGYDSNNYVNGNFEITYCASGK